MKAIAIAALLLWPVLVVNFYKRYSLPVALVVTILGGFLLLPNSTLIDLPVLPALNKTSIPNLIALVMMASILSRSDQSYPALRGWLPRNPPILICLVLLVAGMFMTIITNGDTLVYGARVIPGLSIYDGFSELLALGVAILPFFLGRRVLATMEGQRALLVGFVIGALCYTLPALYEVRMSPVLHYQVYGGFQHAVNQHARGDSWRPLVFVNHGLALALLMTSALLAAVALAKKERPGQKIKWSLAALWLLVMLVVCKSLGPLLIAMVLVPLILFFPTRVQILAAAAIAGMVLTYPVLRASNTIPVDWIMTQVSQVSEDRAESFLIRLDNEENMLAKAQERPLFGWGAWGRDRVYEEDGTNRSLTDGAWIIRLTSGGWVQYIAFFGLLCWPVVGLIFTRRDKIDPVCAALALILCAKLIDLIPNAGVPGIYWLIAGALAGRLEMRQTTLEMDQTPVVNTKMTVGYARHPQQSSVAKTDKDPVYARSFPGRDARRAAPPSETRDKVSYKRPIQGSGFQK